MRRRAVSASPLTILWRGPLSGCNFDCGYCPFAKRKDSRAVLARDAKALNRFVEWVLARDGPTSVLFTPWGEALIRKHYRQALIRLSHAPHVDRVAIQTNLSGPVEWLNACAPAKIGIWATWHPDQIPMARFLARIARLDALGIAYSVGAVGVRAHVEQIEALRAALPTHAYLWINAEESLQGRYSPAEIERWAAIDPWFELNNRAYVSLGRACVTGQGVISVNGEGDARRCHFVDAQIGNIYEPGFEARLAPSPCPLSQCNCHIGYSHLDDLALPGLFGAGFLERRAHDPERAAALLAMARFDSGAL